MFRERSWASSMIRVSYSSRSRSERTSASSRPSVTNLTRVSGEVRSRKRILAPTCRPHSTPISSASRRESEVAATRRGWVTAMRASLPRPARRQILGIWVVLPEPVSPATMTTGCSRTAARISSARRLIGSCSGKSIFADCRARWRRTRVFRERSARPAMWSRSLTRRRGGRPLVRASRRRRSRRPRRTRSDIMQPSRQRSRSASLTSGGATVLIRRKVRAAGDGVNGGACVPYGHA